MTWWLKFYLSDLKRAFTYRAEFWLQLVGSMVSQFGVAYFVWKAVYAHRGTSEIQGYTFAGLMAYYLIAPLSERLVQGGDWGQISKEIYEGGLSRYLVYPVSFFGAKFMSHLAQSTLSLVQLLGVMACLQVVMPGSLVFRPEAWLACVAVLAAAVVVQFALNACLEQLAFWADNVWSLLVMARMLLHLAGGSLLPLSFFSPDLATAFSYLPFHCFIDLPTRLLIGRASLGEAAQGVAVALTWALALGGLARLLWRRGLLRYSGAGM